MRPFKVALVGVEGEPVPDWVLGEFKKEGIDFLSRECSSKEELGKYAGDAHLIWVWGSRVLTADALSVIPACGAILRTGSGTDNVAVDEATRRGILVTNTPDAVSSEVSDHAVGLLFAVIRQIVAQDRAVRSGKWDRRLAWPRWHLRGQTLGIVGFGRIGQLFARKMGGFDLSIIAFDPFMSSAQIAQVGVQAESLEGVLSQSDFVSLHCPLTTETYHLIGERELRLMKPSAVLINTARGSIIDEPALIRALQEGWISAAGLDVLEQEPADLENPLLRLDNVVITPHIAGYSDIYLDCFWRHSVETAIGLANGSWPLSCVNPHVRPRWNLNKHNRLVDELSNQA
jgi:D-3-phosphoglycerate dehydrogenase